MIFHDIPSSPPLLQHESHLSAGHGAFGPVSAAAAGQMLLMGAYGCGGTHHQSKVVLVLSPDLCKTMLVGIIYFRYSTLSRGKKKKKDKKDVELFHSEVNRALLRLYNSVHEH